MDIIFNNSKAKYIQIFEYIKDKINTGILKSDTQLPSRRDLALSLNVSLNTIINAYDLLIDEGYIYSIYKKGYFVTKQPIYSLKPNNIIIDNKSHINIKYDFTTRNVDTFDTYKFKRLIKNVADKYDFLNKVDYKGLYELRLAIKNHLSINRGINCSVDNIIIGSGMEMFEYILECIDNKTLILENPGYHKLKYIAINNNYEIKYANLDDEGVVVPNDVGILYTTPFNQFPTGIKMSIKRKKELIEYANINNTYIIEDDFDAEFRINSSATTSLYSISNDNVIFFSTFSTTIFPGLRIAYTILPNKLMNIYNNKYSKYSSEVSTLLQYTLAEYINEGIYASNLNRRKKSYLEKRELIMNILDEYNIEYDIKRNYLSILIKHKNNNVIDIINKCREKNILIDSLSSYDIDNRPNNILILGYTAISIEDIKIALQELIDILLN